MEIADDFRLKTFLAAHVEDGGGWFDLHQHVPLGVFEPKVSKTFVVKRLEGHDGVARYHVQFFAEDDAFSEDFQSVSRPERSVAALRIMRYIKGKSTTIYEEADPEYPRDNMKRVDWAWTVQEP